MFDSAMWAFNATVRGDVSDYRHTPPDTSGVTLANLRDAVMRLPSAHMTFKRSGQPPLPPIVGFAAVMPTIDHMPMAMQRAAAKHPGLAATLERAKDPAEVVAAVNALWKKVDIEALTPAEKFLTQFGDPVDVALPANGGEVIGLAANWSQTVSKKGATLPFDANAEITFRDPLGRKAKTQFWRPLAEQQQRAIPEARPHHRNPRDQRGRRSRSSDGGQDELKQAVRREFMRSR
jgi:hypothetical protein